jgi:hypothetical protein
MPRYTSGDKTVARKHLWMPCVINDTFDDKTPDEQAAILKATKWADLITNGEWPVLLGQAVNRPVKSRLKKKIVWWLMALGRIAALNPELFDQALREARDLYASQLGETHPLMHDFDGNWFVMHMFDTKDKEATGDASTAPGTR